VGRITDYFPDSQPRESPLIKSLEHGGHNSFYLPEMSFVKENTFVLQEKFYTDTLELESSLKFLRAGARKDVYFGGDEVRAGIVTCGGLCPGLNVVIRSIVTALSNDYSVKKIWGIKWGFRGFYEDFPNNWVPLDTAKVANIHNLGGTILGSSRGGFNAPAMIEAIKKQGINQLYIIGGDGTHRGILAL
jgi:6-phosphofructokinase 1